LGVWSDATNGYDVNFEYLLPANINGYAGIYHGFNPPTWTGDSGYYMNDYRAPLSADESLTFSPIHLWATPEFADPQMHLSILADFDFLPPADRLYSLQLLFVPSGIVGAPLVGSTWTVPLDEILTVTVPTYRAKEGKDGYRFALTISEVVPEPASLVLLATMLALAACRRSRIR
jgi:hypothetical protein